MFYTHKKGLFFRKRETIRGGGGRGKISTNSDASHKAFGGNDESRMLCSCQ